MFAESDVMRRRLLLAALGAALVLPARAAAQEEKKKKTGGEDYLIVNTITGTTTKSGGRRGVLTVDMGLGIPDPKLKAYAELVLPRLRAAYVQVVLTYAAGLPSGAPPNPDLIAQSLQRQTDIVLGRPGAKVLMGAVVAN